MSPEEYEHLVQKFRPEVLTLGSSHHWSVLVRARQVTLGSVVLLAKRGVEDFGDVSPAEATDLFQCTARVQEALVAAFAPERFNLVAAMMKDPFVHFHLIPRYSSTREFGGQEWTDTSWPNLVEFRNVETPDEMLTLVVNELKPMLRLGHDH